MLTTLMSKNRKVYNHICKTTIVVYCTVYVYHVKLLQFKPYQLLACHEESHASDEVKV